MGRSGDIGVCVCFIVPIENIILALMCTIAETNHSCLKMVDLGHKPL